MKIKSMKLEEPTKTTLMYDSGAQSTVVNDIQLLSNPIPREATVSVANDGISIATHVGKLILCGQGITITLPKAWYCPLMSNNFISTHDIAEAGYTVGHDTDTLWVISNDGQQRYIIAKNPGDRAFYGDTKLKPISLPIITRVSKQQYVKISNVAISEMPITYGRKNMIYYHLVCGHASVEALKSLKKLNVLEFNDSPEDEERIRLCQTCRRVNLTAKPHNKTHIPAERIHERIHSDTMGPIEGSKGKSIYITTLTDEFSRYMEVVITSTKSFKEELLRKIHVWSNRFPDKPIRYFRSDNAQEMPSEEDLSKYGIQKEPISSYSPQQNGFAEAMNKIIIRNVQKIIAPLESRNYLPLLPSIIEHAVYTTNLHKPHGRPDLPYSVYHKKGVEESKYMMYGVDVIVKLNNAQEARTAGITYSKFSNTAMGSYIGHHGDAGYRILVNSGNILYTKDVTFIEPHTHEQISIYFDHVDLCGAESLLENVSGSDQLINAREIREHLAKYPSTGGCLEEEQPIDDRESDAIVTAPLTEEVDDSYVIDYANVPNQPGILTAVDVPDVPTLEFSRRNMSAGQSDPDGVPRRASLGELEDNRGTVVSGIADSYLKGLENSRIGLRTRVGGSVSGPISGPQRDAAVNTAVDAEDKRMPSPLGAGETHYSSQISNTLGSNVGDDGHGTAGWVRRSGESLSEPSTSKGQGIREGEPLLGVTMGRTSVVPGSVTGREHGFPEVKSVSIGAEPTSSTTEPTLTKAPNEGTRPGTDGYLGESV